MSSVMEATSQESHEDSNNERLDLIHHLDPTAKDVILPDETFLKAAISLKDQVVEATWKRDNNMGAAIDPTVYTGLLGTAFTCLRSYEVTGNKQDLLLCSTIVDACSISAHDSSRCIYIVTKAAILKGFDQLELISSYNGGVLIKQKLHRWIMAWLEGLLAGLQRRCEPPVALKELKIREMTITSLKVEVGKLREMEAKLLENDNSLENLKQEFTKAKSAEEHSLDLLSQSKKRIQELEAEVQRGKESEMKLLDSFVAQTKQLEQTKLLLEESKLEITSLHARVEGWEKDGGDKISLQKELESLKSELQFARQNRTPAQAGGKHSASKTKNRLEGMELLKHELKLATKAEENSKKAMDDLVLALSEVATEASHTREKLVLTEKELEHFKTEAEKFQENLNSIEDKYRNLLNIAAKESDRYRKTTERLRMEAEESLLAWNEKETGFVDCIKRAEDEKSCALKENSKLVELLKTAENMNGISKQETQKVRDILKQALNEANVAKEAAGIARAENSHLKDVLAEKDIALVFITQENENLRINESAALEHIKELKKFLSEASEKEFIVEDKENQLKKKPQNAQEKQHKDGKKPGHSCSCHLKELITPHKHKDADENSKTPDKKNNNDGDSVKSDPLRGSIFDDQAESPTAKPEDYDHLADPENERNSMRKRAYLRRFGDILLRRGGSNRRGQPVGDEGPRKELSL